MSVIGDVPHLANVAEGQDSPVRLRRWEKCLGSCGDTGNWSKNRNDWPIVGKTRLIFSDCFFFDWFSPGTVGMRSRVIHHTFSYRETERGSLGIHYFLHQLMIMDGIGEQKVTKNGLSSAK